MAPEQHYETPRRGTSNNPYQAIVDVINILLRKIAIAPKNRLTGGQVKIHIVETALAHNALGVEELAQILKTLQQAGAIGNQLKNDGILSSRIRMPGMGGIEQSGGEFTIFHPNKELLLKQRNKWINEGNEPDRPQSVDITPSSPFHQPTMAEIQREADDGMREFRRQSFEERLQRKAFKQQRILAAKEDKYTHALNILIEWAEHYGDGKSFPLDYHYFNFEDRMDDSRMFEHFLDKLKGAGCFKSWGRTNYAGGTRFGFLEVSLGKLRAYKEKQKEAGAEETKETTGPAPPGTTIFYNKEAGIGYVAKKSFKLKDNQPEYRVFAKLYDNINKKVARAKVLELMELKEGLPPEQAGNPDGIKRVARETATYKISELAKKIRERTGLTTSTLVLNNGNLTLLGTKLKHPPE